MKVKSLLVCILVTCYVISFAQTAQTDYQQFEVIYVKPKLDKVDLFKKALTAHNKKYHATAPYKVSVYSVDTGPYSGAYAWVMGPVTWTQMDAAPGQGEHIVDWEKNINPNCEYVGETTYWRNSKEVNYQAEGAATFNKSRLRFSYIRPGQMDRFMDQMKKVVEVFKQKKYAASFSLAARQGSSAGPHVVSFLDFAKWAYFDNGSDFVKDFNEVHGTGSYDRFIEELDICTDRSKTYDELSSAVPELGG